MKNLTHRPHSSHARFAGLLVALLVAASAAHAQSQLTTLNVSQELTLSTSPVTRWFGLRSGGSIYDVGPRVGGDVPSLDLRLAPGNANGEVSTFLWDAGKTAFRVGLYQSDSLNPSTMGASSFAYGYRSLATATASLAGGLLTQATGYGAVALGSYSTATGIFSFAVGDTVHAIGGDDFAAGIGTTAMGGASAAFNHGTMSSGYASFAAGFGTRANAIASAAFGSFNLGGATAGGNATWYAQDTVFEIGNGTDDWHRSNALTVYKNGTVIIPKPQGDILMGEFGN